MSFARNCAREYLAPPPGAPWKWADDGQTLLWADGSVVAFRAEVETVLTRLAPTGFPPFGAVALMLASCREGWRTPSGGRAASLLALAKELTKTGSASSRLVHTLIADVLQRLEAIHALPEECRTGAGKKATLALRIFGRTKGVGKPEDARTIVEGLGEGLGPRDLDPSSGDPAGWPFLLPMLSVLRGCLPAEIRPEDLRAIEKTGLEEIPLPAPIDLSPSERVRALLLKLRGEPEWSGLARLAHDLMAAVHVPRPVSEREEIPVGGVSDITNRGPLDRLLLSELANDDAILAVRLALNEALFTRRESPPGLPPRRRALLLDCGVRLWGLPRLFATAVALALTATTRRDEEVPAWRSSAGGVERIDLTTREGLIDHLGRLEAAPHPGASLRPFLEAAESPDTPVDAVLVTHADAASDPDFLRELDGIDRRPLFLATVARDGAFRLSEVTPWGRKSVREAVLSLRDVLPPPEPSDRAAPLVARDRRPDLPLIFGVEPFPLYLPEPVARDQICYHEDGGVVAAVRDGRLLHFEDLNRGGRQIADLLPKGRLLSMAIRDDGSVHAAVHTPGSPEVKVLFCHLRSGEQQVVGFGGGRPLKGAAFYDPLLLLITRAGAALEQILVIDTVSRAQVADFVGSAGMHWQRSGRFFRDRDGWYALTWDGTQARMERLEGRHHHLFDRPGTDGPWDILPESGSVISISSGVQIPLKGRIPAEFLVKSVSRDGHRVALSAGPSPMVLDLKSGVVNTGYQAFSEEPAAAACLPRHRGLRRKFESLAFDSDGRLVLRQKRGSSSVLRLDRGQILLDSWSKREGPDSPVFPLRKAGFVAGTRIRLRSHPFADGSAAYLDSRGLFHLVSSDRALPEITLVLSDGRTAAWTSEGDLYGNRFFTGMTEDVPADRLHELIRSFAQRVK
ncbi:MAG: hypothetical protein HYY93_13595 [Planctomycetes bacterium]|nr:hypothetical protein [Planctomycetota bacterium]